MPFEPKYKKLEDSKFRRPSGQRLSSALFLEFSPEDKSRCLYTLDRSDKEDPDTGKIYRSLYQCYMEMGDIYERDFALAYFESWEHWDNIRKTQWMKPYIEKWRNELELQIRSEALMRIQMEASGTGKNAYNANLYLVKAGWKEQEEKTVRKGAGRPSKAQVQEEAAKLAMESHDIKADLKRLGLVN